MANKNYDLAHTKWMCKYHIVFTPKYRRKVIYNQLKVDIRDILKQLCSYKGVEIIEGHLMPDHAPLQAAASRQAYRGDLRVLNMDRTIGTWKAGSVENLIFMKRRQGKSYGI